MSSAAVLTASPAIFNDGDSAGWGVGVQVTILRPLLVPDEADEEVGPMFKVQRADGATKDAFADELVQS